MDRTSATRGPGAGILAALMWTLMLLPFCKGRELPQGQCVFNSDCSNNEICAGNYCRSQCNPANGQGDRDCVSMFGSGWHCRPSGQGSIDVCTPPNDEGYCVYSSQCNAPLVCALNGRCANQCVTDYDCQIIALDQSAMCDMGTCSFRDAGLSADAGTPTTDASADAATDVAAADTGG